MRDIGNEETEKLIADLEKKIRKEYQQAERELNEKFNDYVRKFKIKDEIKRKQLANGEITQEFYEYWRKGQFSVAFRWQEMRRTMADDLTTVSQKARSIVDGYRPEAYAINHDYITFLIEKDSGIDTSYTLYNTRSAERLLRDERVLPKPGKSMKGKIERGEVVKWQEGRIQSVTLQSLLQGESTEHMAQRICRTLSTSNMSDAIRYARTAMTGAQNGGRFDAISRCREEGIDVVGQWSATLDGRTRHTHRQVDGEVVEPGEMFSNGCRFPGDPNGPPAEIWHCRCRLNERVRGYTKDPSDLTRRNTDHMEEETYEEWKSAKAPKKKTSTSKESKPTYKTHEEYKQYRTKQKETMEKNIENLNKAHEKEQDKLLESYGGNFMQQRRAISHNESLTEEQKEKAREQIRAKKEKYNAERDAMEAKLQRKIDEEKKKYAGTFDPEFEYKKIKGNSTFEDNARVVNPNFTTFNIEYTENCQRCSVAYELRCRGYDVEALGAPDLGYGALSYVKETFPEVKPKVFSNDADAWGGIIKEADAWGDGSRGIISVTRADGTGHLFNVVNDKGVVKFVDSQSGGIWEASTNPGAISSAYETTLLRTDNAKIYQPQEGWVKSK